MFYQQDPQQEQPQSLELPESMVDRFKFLATLSEQGRLLMVSQMGPDGVPIGYVVHAVLGPGGTLVGYAPMARMLTDEEVKAGATQLGAPVQLPNPGSGPTPFNTRAGLRTPDQTNTRINLPWM